MTLPTRRTVELSRWDPLHEFEQLTGQMNDLLESAFSRLPSQPSQAMTWSPAADVEETDDAYIVDADLPGVKRDDVKVELRDNELVISGDIKQQERKGLLRRQTRRTGHFEYRLMLPSDVNADTVEANLHDGVLRLRVPKAAKAKPRQIQVSSD